MTAGCTGALRGGILYLTLDTRGSSVNVFTPAVALELERELEAGLEAGARAVVVQSKKPGSFINGVGLLLAASSHSEEAAMERAHALQRCYLSLAAAPVPTIAAIEGNCYGCGLELALTCDYRIARDSYDTHFYMPELRDYAFIPLFGATQRLPRLLGLGAGLRLLLGERLDARRALRLGLIDRLAPDLRKALPGFLSGLRARGWPKRELRRPPQRPLPRLADLPGPERQLARECLRLSRLTLRRGYRLEDGLRDELAGFWRTVGTRDSERAMSFFFIRQAAKAHAIGSALYRRPERLKVHVDRSLPALARLFRLRPLPGVQLGPAAGADIAFAAKKIRGVLTCAVGSLQPDADCSALLPLAGEDVPPIELVPTNREMPWRAGAPLFQFLEQAGFAPVVSRARGRFVSKRLLDALTAALREAPSAQVRSELLEFGFRLPKAVARRLGSRKARRRQKNLAGRAVEALAREAIRALDDGTLVHPSQADLLAHLLCGFPVVRGGLLRCAAGSKSPIARSARRVLGQR